MAKDKADKEKSKDTKSNEIWVTTFDEESAQEFRERLMERAAEGPQDPIVIYIDSYGGYVDSLAKMIECMDEVNNPIITVCMGKAMSCGAILFSHGDARFCGRHSRIMVHEVSSATWGDVHDMHADAIETKRLNEYFMDLLAKNCNIQGGYSGLRKMIKERDGRDIYLDAEQAVKFGIADFVGLPKVIQATMTEVGLIDAKKRNKLGDKPAFKKSRKK